MNIHKRFRECWLRITQQRIDIFNEIQRIHHFSYDDLEKKLKNIWRASIFRTLKLFNSIWVIKIINSMDWAVMYEINDNDHHHEHMKCTACKKIIEFDDSILHAGFEKIAKKNNFILEKHSLLFEWKCSECY